MITVTNVTKKYRNRTVLGPVTLTIPRGGITALVGPNGAGKSTLLTIMGRLVPPTTGSVAVGGLDVATTPSARLAQVVSILRQENHFVSRLTVRELVGFGRFPYSRGRLTVTDVEAIDRALDYQGLTELADSPVDELSGGQRQRAYVAMVLAQDTDYILLDEPLNNLDMRHSVAMMKELRRAADEWDKTFVIVIHDINFASAYADHIVALSHGSVVHTGSPAELMRSDILEEIFDTPIEVSHEGAYPLAVYCR